MIQPSPQQYSTPPYSCPHPPPNGSAVPSPQPSQQGGQACIANLRSAPPCNNSFSLPGYQGGGYQPPYNPTHAVAQLSGAKPQGGLHAAFDPNRARALLASAMAPCGAALPRVGDPLEAIQSMDMSWPPSLTPSLRGSVDNGSCSSIGCCSDTPSADGVTARGMSPRASHEGAFPQRGSQGSLAAGSQRGSHEGPDTEVEVA